MNLNFLGTRPAARRKRRAIAAATVALLGASVLTAGLAYAVTPHPEIPLDKNNLQTLTVQGVTPTADGATFDLGGYVGLVRLYSEDVLKISVQPKGKAEYFSPAIQKRDWGTPKFKHNRSKKNYSLKTDKITVEISTDRFGVRVLDPQGNVINADDMAYGSGYEAGKPYVFKKTEPGEDFYGFGEQTRGLNKRGDSIRMWNTDNYAYSPTEKYLYASIPFFMGLKPNGHAYGVFFDNTHRSYFEMASERDDYYYFYADGGDLNYYFFNGPDIPNVLESYTELTGRYQQPPNWSLGWQQSSWGYEPAQKIVDVAKGYRDRGIPLDTMNLDIDYMDEFRVFTWGEGFENPEALDAQLESMGVSTVTINDPAVKVDDGYSVYDSGNDIGAWATNPDGSDYVGSVWPGPSKFPDFTRQDVRNWWAGHHGTLLDRGVEGIWLDMNEPAVFDNEYHTIPNDTEFNHGTQQATEIHNLYGMLETHATTQGFEQFQPNQRPFILTRDMYAGSQRDAALWTGDNVSTWDHLAMSLPMQMNIGLSGVPHVGSDIGGFAGQATPELMARWLQAGAFYPHARVHYQGHGNDGYSQEPWSFGPEVEAIAKKYVSLRYQLMPYLVTAFHEASVTGAPVQRPLVYEFQNDPKVRDLDHEFMWGDDLLVAPVVQQGATSREVYLPAGSKWTDWWTGKSFEGGQTITAAAPLDVLPIYVQSNSIVANRAVQQFHDEKPLTDLVLDAWVDTAAKSTFYEDDGATKDHQKGEYDETEFSATRSGQDITLEKRMTHDAYDSTVTTVTWRLHDVPAPKGATAATVSYDPKTKIATVTAPAAATAVKVHF